MGHVRRPLHCGGSTHWIVQKAVLVVASRKSSIKPSVIDSFTFVLLRNSLQPVLCLYVWDSVSQSNPCYEWWSIQCGHLNITAQQYVTVEHVRSKAGTVTAAVTDSSFLWRLLTRFWTLLSKVFLCAALVQRPKLWSINRDQKLINRDVRSNLKGHLSVQHCLGVGWMFEWKWEWWL